MNNLPSWPPESGEPIVPATVVARLDTLGWSAGTYELIDHTDRFAVIKYRTVFEPYALLALTDGHTVARYTDAGSARDIISRLKAREQEEQS